MRALILSLALLAPTPAAADAARAVDTVLLPGLSAFAQTADALAQGAARDCTRGAVLPLYAAARDAWGAVGDIRLGPTERAALTIAFWPDDRGSGLRALRGGATESAMLPASARGFAGLDLMLGDPGLAYGPGDPGCATVAALADDLAGQARALAVDWDAFAPALRSPGGAGNAVYLDGTEAAQALMTQALAALELTEATRLGRPLGTPDRPRPARAEAWRTARPLPNALASLRGAVALARALTDAPLPRTEAALAAVEAAARAIADPSFQDLATDPAARGRLAILQTRVAGLRTAMGAELGAALGVAPGFNALDGD